MPLWASLALGAPCRMSPAASAANAAPNAVPWEARHLIEEPMVQHKLSRNGPVSLEVTAMDIGPEITRVWNELDRFITTVVQSDRENVIERAMDLADRLVKAQIGLADTLYRREWDEVTAPLLSIAAWHKSRRIDCVQT